MACFSNCSAFPRSWSTSCARLARAYGPLPFGSPVPCSRSCLCISCLISSSSWRAVSAVGSARSTRRTHAIACVCRPARRRSRARRRSDTASFIGTTSTARLYLWPGDGRPLNSTSLDSFQLPSSRASRNASSVTSSMRKKNVSPPCSSRNPKRWFPKDLMRPCRRASPPSSGSGCAESDVCTGSPVNRRWTSRICSGVAASAARSREPSPGRIGCAGDAILPESRRNRRSIARSSSEGDVE